MSPTEDALEPAKLFIAIPSYGRADVIGGKTLAVLQAQGVSQEDVFIFVADECERERYVRNLGDQWPNIVIGVPTLWKQRNFITSYFEEGSHVLSMDDDVESISRLVTEPCWHLEPLHPGGLVAIANDAWQKMHQSGAHLWSLNVSDNCRSMKPASVTLINGLCNGVFWGCKIRKDPSLLLQYGDGHEDIERTVRYFHQDGAVLRYHEFCATTSKTNEGGLQASMKREARLEAELRSVTELVKEFPHLLEFKPGSIPGVKFRQLGKSLAKRSMILPTHFKDLAAGGKLAFLEGALWIGLHASGAKKIVAGTIERISLHKICSSTTDHNGEKCFLGTDTMTFYECIRCHQIFIVWLTSDSCAKLGISYREVDPALETLLKCHKQNIPTRKSRDDSSMNLSVRKRQTCKSKDTRLVR